MLEKRGIRDLGKGYEDERRSLSTTGKGARGPILAEKPQNTARGILAAGGVQPYREPWAIMSTEVHMFGETHGRPRTLMATSVFRSADLFSPCF